MSDEAERDSKAAPETRAAAATRPEPTVDAPGGPAPERTESLNQRLLRLELQGVPPEQGADTHSADDDATPPRPRSALKAIGIGFAIALAVGLGIAGWINRAALIAAWQASPRSTLDLYPPSPSGAQTRIAVTVTDTPGTPGRDIPHSALAARPEPIKLADTTQPCSASLTEVQAGILFLRLNDPARAGHAITIRVDEFDYRASFARDGELMMFAPRLLETGNVRWPGADGSPCTTTTAGESDEPQLRVALVWDGEARLALHILEPKGWVGAPTGHISADRPNLSYGHGAGQLYAFGQPLDPTRLQVYLVNLARLGQSGVLTAIVTLEPAAALEACAARGQQQEIRYQLYTLRTDKNGAGRPDIRSLGFELPDCSKGKVDPPVERIAIRF
jgi:hypothetical protein